MTLQKMNSTTVEALTKIGGVPIGSVALGEKRTERDLDIAITLDMYNDFVEKFGKNSLFLRKTKISNYFHVIPIQDEQGFLLRGGELDIIVLSKQKDLDVVRKTMETLLSIPKRFLEDKYIRVQLFEQELVHNGFKYKQKEDKHLGLAF